VTFYGEGFAFKFGDKTATYCIMTTHRLTFLFHQGNFDQKQHYCRPPTHPYFLFPRLKINLKDRHFDTAEVKEREGDCFEGDDGQ
jgi:hypothetical protein